MLIENVIQSLGVDPQLCKGEKEGQYNLQRGSAAVWVDVWQSEGQEYGYLQVMAPVLEIPPNNREAFYRELLDINHQLYGVAMTTYGSWVYAKSVRELEGLDENEARAILSRVGACADQYDDQLKAKYYAMDDRR